MINVGIVGLGFMSVAHIKAYRQTEGVRIVAVCNPSGRKLDGNLSSVSGNVGTQEEVKLDMNEVKGYQDFDSFLKHPDLDVVDICTPTKTHAKLATRALACGKHVLCEKPLVRKSGEAELLLQAAKEAKGFFMPAMCMRFWPEWTWLKEAMEDQRFGRVMDARFRRVAEPPGWGQDNYFTGTESGGALLDLHIHDVDLVQYYFGSPSRVVARGYSKHSSAIDHVMCLYDVDCGAVVSAEGSWGMSPGFGFTMGYTVNFERATADCDITRGEDALKLYQEGKDPEVLKFTRPDGYIGELAYFTECIRNQTPPKVVTLEDAVHAVRICEAEERSIQSGSIESIH